MNPLPNQTSENPLWPLGACMIAGWSLVCLFVFALFHDFGRGFFSRPAIFGIPFALWLVGTLLAGWKSKHVEAVLTSVPLEILLFHAVVALGGSNILYHLMGRHYAALAFVALAVPGMSYLFVWPAVAFLCFWHFRRPNVTRHRRWLREFVVLTFQVFALYWLLPCVN